MCSVNKNYEQTIEYFRNLLTYRGFCAKIQLSIICIIQGDSFFQNNPDPAAGCCGRDSEGMGIFMSGSKFCKRLAAVFCAFCCMLLSLPAGVLSAFAAGNDRGSITITCRTEDTMLVGMQWDLFLVAYRNENYYDLIKEYQQAVEEAKTYGAPIEQPNIYRTVGQFKGTPVLLNDKENDAWTAAAITLENEASVKKYKPDRTVFSGTDGEVFFDDVPQGLYLLSGKRLTIGDTTYIPTPMLVEIVKDDYLNDLHFNSLPKMTLRTRAGADSRYTVKKVWQKDAGYAFDRSLYITVVVYKNGEYLETATLDESNNWQMTWYGEADAEWRVQEVDIPDKYTVIYKSNETQFVIENTYNPWYDSSSDNEDWTPGTTTPETSTTIATETTADFATTAETTSFDDSNTTDVNTSTTGDDSSTSTVVTSTTGSGSGGGGGSGSGSGSGGGSGGGGGGSGSGSGGGGKLPQTGQLWWPVPFLGLGGIVFIMIGWRLQHREE